MKKYISLLIVFILCLQSALCSEKDDQIIYAMLMNQIQYSLLTVQHYKSRTVLKKEYDNIICKIDKTKLADENGDAIEAYSNLLDTLTELKLSENEKQFLTIQAEKEKKQAVNQILTGSASAVGMAAIAFAGGNPVSAVSGLLFTGVSGVFNYRNAVNATENSLNASLFRISQNDIHLLDGERNSLFKTYSRFITKYKIPKKYEIKEDQMKWLVEALDNLDAQSKVRLLETKKDIFALFTPFWFELGSAYQAVGNEKKAKECYAEFEKQKRKYSIIDNDSYYTELAKNMIKMCHDTDKMGKIKPYVDIIEADQTVANENENRMYLAELYYSLGEEEKAREKLRLVMDDGREFVARAREFYTLIDAYKEVSSRKKIKEPSVNESIARSMIFAPDGKIIDAVEEDSSIMGMAKNVANSVYSFFTNTASQTPDATLMIELPFYAQSAPKTLCVKNEAGNVFYADLEVVNGTNCFVFADGILKILDGANYFDIELGYEDGRYIEARYSCYLCTINETAALYSMLAILKNAGLALPELDELDIRSLVSDCVAFSKDASFKKKSDREKQVMIEDSIAKARRSYLLSPYSYYREVSRISENITFCYALQSVKDFGKSYTFSKYGDVVLSGN